MEFDKISELYLIDSYRLIRNNIQFTPQEASDRAVFSSSAQNGHVTQLGGDKPFKLRYVPNSYSIVTDTISFTVSVGDVQQTLLIDLILPGNMLNATATQNGQSIDITFDYPENASRCIMDHRVYAEFTRLDNNLQTGSFTHSDDFRANSLHDYRITCIDRSPGPINNIVGFTDIIKYMSHPVSKMLY